MKGVNQEIQVMYNGMEEFKNDLGKIHDVKNMVGDLEQRVLKHIGSVELKLVAASNKNLQNATDIRLLYDKFREYEGHITNSDQRFE